MATMTGATTAITAGAALMMMQRIATYWMMGSGQKCSRNCTRRKWGMTTVATIWLSMVTRVSIVWSSIVIRWILLMKFIRMERYRHAGIQRSTTPSSCGLAYNNNNTFHKAHILTFSFSAKYICTPIKMVLTIDTYIAH